MASDRYRVLRGAGAGEPPKTKGSRFLADAVPVASDDAVAAALDAIRRREPQATHWCWAARMGAPGASGDGATPRTSDDGEPSGSAGLPILREIDRRGLSDTLVVVTRYYGGTKLGTGGLARAYSEAAGVALDAAPVGLRTVRVPVRLAFAFDDTSAAMRLLDTFDAVLQAQDYSPEGTVLTLSVRETHVDPLREAFIEATSGRGRVD